MRISGFYILTLKILVLSRINHKMGFENRIEVDLVNKEAKISLLENDKQQEHRGETTLLKYDHEQLTNIGKHVKGNRKLKILDGNVVNIIRNLRIYCQGCRGKRRTIPD